MLFSGIELHKRSVAIHTLDAETVVRAANLPAQRRALTAYFGTLPGPHRAVVQCTGMWYWVRDLLVPQGRLTSYRNSTIPVPICCTGTRRSPGLRTRRGTSALPRPSVTEPTRRARSIAMWDVSSRVRLKSAVSGEFSFERRSPSPA
jgi:hypothetical protein